MEFKDELRLSLFRKVPSLIRSFGDIESFFEYSSAFYATTIDHFIYTILSNYRDILVLYPSSFSFELGDVTSLKSSIILEQPYSVYDKEGRLLYSVSSHNGIFGESVLDRTLILSSSPMDYYYLKYKTYGGSETKMLFIGIVIPRLQNRMSSEEDFSNRTPVLANTNQDSILLNVDNALQSSTVTKYPLRLHFIESAPSPQRTRQGIIDLGAINDYDIEQFSLSSFFPTTSGYFTFSQVTSSGLEELNVIDVTGLGTDRWFEVSPSVYYLGLTKDINIDVLRQVFNIFDGPVPELNLSSTLTLNLTLEPV
jgi:hypothetical protein